MKNKIIADLFKSSEFNACISKMRPVTLQDELRSEVALILCEMPEEKVMNLHESGALRFYTVRIILNLTQSNTSPFYKKFRMPTVELGEVPDQIAEEFDHAADIKKSLAISEVENLYWYDKEIVKLYMRLGNYRAVEAETGIPFESVYKTVQRACKIIKKKVA